MSYRISGQDLVTSAVVAGKHNDAFELPAKLRGVLKDIKRPGIAIKGAYLKADRAIDTKEARKVCFNHGVMPNMPENKRNRQQPKRGRQRLFTADG